MLHAVSAHLLLNIRCDTKIPDFVRMLDNVFLVVIVLQCFESLLRRMVLVVPVMEALLGRVF